jgi:hypothetical protein
VCACFVMCPALSLISHRGCFFSLGVGAKKGQDDMWDKNTLAFKSLLVRLNKAHEDRSAGKGNVLVCLHLTVLPALAWRTVTVTRYLSDPAVGVARCHIPTVCAAAKRCCSGSSAQAHVYSSARAVTAIQEAL